MPQMTDWPPPSWGIPQLLQADVDWVLNRTARRIAEYILPKMRETGIKSVVEFGCGSGLLCGELPPEIIYTGIDTNEWFLKRAIERGASREPTRFLNVSVRDYPPEATADLSMAWSFLKHFGLSEFDSILTKLLACGRFAAFNVSHLPFDIDDGTEYHHVYVTRERIEHLVHAAGHKIIDATETESWQAHGQTARGVFYWTRRQGAVLQAGDSISFEGVRPISITNEENTMFDREAAEKAAQVPHPSDIVITTPIHHNVNLSNIGGVTDVDWDGNKIAHLEVAGDGYKPDALYEFSLRWLADGTPTLYHRGKRVTKPWKFRCDLDVPADEHGGNANTD